MDKTSAPPASLLFTDVPLFLQNIVKKVIGQKFVYRFVSFPDILKMDPAAVESGRGAEETGGPASEPEAEDEDGVETERRLRSGLYSSLTTSSLNRPIKAEPGSDRHDDSSSVIQYVTNGGLSSSPSAESAARSPRLASPCSLPRSPAHRWTKGRGQCPDTDESDCQPLNLSYGQREKLQSSAAPERRARSKGRKPKGLEISASSLLLTGSDLVSIALNSPALPSGSLTPAFLTTQVQPSHRCWPH